jgi:hypothetical protein
MKRKDKPVFEVKVYAKEMAKYVPTLLARGYKADVAFKLAIEAVVKDKLPQL